MFCVTYHHRIDFIVVAIHPIGGHGFSVFDANFGHFLSGAGWQKHQSIFWLLFFCQVRLATRIIMCNYKFPVAENPGGYWRNLACLVRVETHNTPTQHTHTHCVANDEHCQNPAANKTHEHEEEEEEKKKKKRKKTTVEKSAWSCLSEISWINEVQSKNENLGASQGLAKLLSNVWWRPPFSPPPHFLPPPSSSSSGCR